MPTPSQGRYWLLTIPKEDFQPDQFSNDERLTAIIGQLEVAPTTGYEHWQLCVCFPKKLRLRGVQAIFGQRCHAELSRSAAAQAYCCKEETAIEGTRFSFGKFPNARTTKRDWEQIREAAKDGKFDQIDPDIYFRYYGNMKKIHVDNLKPQLIEREIVVYWGKTGTGKSHRAWEEAGMDAYPKTPTTKFWDGYSGQEHVVIDEFRGQVDISHVLRWFDKYPTIVEVKGSSCVFRAKKIWITSNLDPREWYPNLDEETKKALLRRLKITHFTDLRPEPPAPPPPTLPSPYDLWTEVLLEAGPSKRVDLPVLPQTCTHCGGIYEGKWSGLCKDCEDKLHPS